MEDFGLSDDLYIKMNARGKLLSSFENLKAEIQQKSKDLNWENGTCDEYASYRWAETALNYLKGKKVYFMYDKMTKEEAEDMMDILW